MFIESSDGSPVYCLENFVQSWKNFTAFERRCLLLTCGFPKRFDKADSLQQWFKDYEITKLRNTYLRLNGEYLGGILHEAQTEW